jgi:outer membrane lipoprotein-sorting protein
MKRLTGILLVLMIAPAAFTVDVDAILTEADQAFTQGSIYSTSDMIVSSNGRVRQTMSMESYSLVTGDDTQSLMIFTEPRRMRGTAYLTVDGEIWVRFGSTGRVRKLRAASMRDSAAGSDFSYADMGEGSAGVSANYNARLIEENERYVGTPCYQVELLPTSDDPPYEKLVACIAHSDNQYRAIGYYEDGALTKTMTLSDYRTVDGVDYPYLVRMQNHAANSQTDIVTHQIFFEDPRVNEGVFTVEYLEAME